MQNQYILGTLICWFVFALFWILLRNKVKTDINQQTTKQKLGAIFGFAIYFCLMYWPALFPAKYIIPHTENSGMAGIIICAAGILLCVWSRLILGVDWSGGVAIKHDHQLKTAGPYKLVRHPIYTGFIIALLGSAIAVGHISGFIALLLVFLGLVVKIKQEEKILGEKFGDSYAEYQKKTKKLIPFLW